MNTTARRVLFYFFILAFVILGAYLLLTAQGLVFDARNFTFVKTGALFLKFNPSGASLMLNGSPKDASEGFVVPGVLITDLKPGAYNLVLQKKGYAPWVKNLSVTSGIVTAMANIELWPQQFTFTEVAKDPISDFWITQSGAVTSNAKHTLHLDGTTLKGTSVIASDKDSDYLVSSDGKSYFFTDLQTPANGINISSLYTTLSARASTSTVKSEPIAHILLHPFSTGKLLVVTANNLYSLDIRRTQLTPLATLPGIVAATTSDNEVLLLDGNGKLLVFNLLLQTTNEYLLGLTDISKIKTNPGGDIVFLLGKNGDLSEYTRSTGTLALLAHNVISFSLSPGEERLALLRGDGTLHMLALKDYHGDTDIMQGTEWNIAIPDSLGTPEIFSWLTNFPNYGLLEGTERTMIIELDNRAPQNTYTVSGDIKEAFLEGNTLYAMEGNGSFVETTLGE